MRTSEQIDIIQFRESLADIRKEQLIHASSIIASQERVASQIDIAASTINSTLNDIGSMLNWQLSNIAWILEQQNEILRQILATLESPLDTAAKELRRRAEEAFRNGWYEEALEDFLKSEKSNPYDFTVYQSIGLIHFNENNYDTALNYFLKAAKYAKPKSPEYSGYSLLFVSKIHRIKEDYKSCLSATKEAILLAPTLAEAHYQHAINLSNINAPEEAVTRLKHSIKLDRYYVLKPRTDTDCKKIIPYLENLEHELYLDAKANATNAIARASKANLLTQESEEVHTVFEKAEGFYNRDSYFDYLDSETSSKKSIAIATSFVKAKIQTESAKALGVEGKIERAGCGITTYVVLTLIIGMATMAISQAGVEGVLAVLVYLAPPAIWMASQYWKQNSIIALKSKWETILNEIGTL